MEEERFSRTIQYIMSRQAKRGLYAEWTTKKAN